MTGYNIRQFMADGRTLRHYLSGRLPSFDNIRQHLFLLERNIGFRRPDHFYHNWSKHHFDKIDQMGPHYQPAAFLKACFDELTKLHLVVRHNLVKVEPHRFEDWQALLPRVPPLPLMSFKLYRHFNFPESVGEYTEYCRQKLVPNFRRTALPSPHAPHMDRLVNNNGLIDIHVHLNGTTEMDRVWLHILSFPEDFQTSLTDEVLENDMVKEQFDQIEEGISINRIHYRIRLASWLRYILIQQILEPKIPEQPSGLQNFKHYINEEFRLLEDPCYSLRTHPLSDGLPGLHEFNDSVLESLFHIMVFRYMDRHPANDTFARAYHLYLLILGFFNKLMVQQIEQFGFDQFQKITLNTCRDSVEKEYTDRFFQVCGNEENHVTLLEGRFAPKDTFEKNIELLDRIFNGYQSYYGGNDAFTSITQDSVVETGQRMRLSLTAHFIKERDMEWQTGVLLVRHHGLRQSIEQKARAIIYLCSELRRVQEILHGIDAASNELQASPEVFSPIYRRLRRNGFRHFTYHSGEDFAHLLSGLRTLFEAVEFLELQSGDRIGHATALGIQPDLWFERMGETIILPQGEWLDNLVFAAKLLRTSSDEEAQQALSQIYHEIEIYSRRIYGHPVACSILEDAWLLRKLDPLIAFSGDSGWESSLDPGDWVEQEMIDTARQNNDEAFEWFRHYHTTPDRRQAYFKTSPIPLFQVVDFGKPQYVVFSPEVLRIIQQEILKRLHQKNIALESMPTSNIRISAYDSYRQHHLWRWLGFTKEDNPKDPYLPSVCIGSDDPGIFATNIKNEYLHIYYGLMQYWNLSQDDAFAHVIKLTENSKAYSFL